MKKYYTLIALAFLYFNSYGQETGIEIIYSKVTTSIDLPRLLQGIIPNIESGTKSDIGIGVVHDLGTGLSLRGGVHQWKVPFIPTVNASKTNKDDYVIENGLLTYFGIYMRAEYNIEYFFIGGGLDMSLSNKYNADRTYFDNGVNIGTEKGVTNSVLTSNFNNVINIMMDAGFKIPIGSIKIKPFASVGASFSSIYPIEKTSTLSNGPFFQINYTEPQKVDLQYIPIVNYGISIEYTISKN